MRISVDREGEGFWLHVSDTGLGMSRYVLTEVLLDFGNSLWREESVNEKSLASRRAGLSLLDSSGSGSFQSSCWVVA